MTVVFTTMETDTVEIINDLHPKSKFPWLSKAICIIGLAGFFLIGLLLGYASGYGITKKHIHKEIVNKESCPPLEAQFLNTTLPIGMSFEGDVVSLSCTNDYLPYPTSVMCRKKNSSNTSLEWSHLPVCYPKTLMSNNHWEKTPWASSVTCTGNNSFTQCKLKCFNNDVWKMTHVPVEESPYICDESPCAAWTLGPSDCYMCDRKCHNLLTLRHTERNPMSMVKALGCSCGKIVVTSTLLEESKSRTAFWQDPLMGLYHFVGEHHGRPLYQNIARQYLYYFFKAEWLIGTSFMNSKAGIQVFGNYNSDNVCPEAWIRNSSHKYYVDPSYQTSSGSSKWISDPTIHAECLDQISDVVNCSCVLYEVSKKPQWSGEVDPQATKMNFTGKFKKVNDSLSLGYLAPVYFNAENKVYLYSHHHKGLVWQISESLSGPRYQKDLKGVSYVGQNETSMGTCPDSNKIVWQWTNHDSHTTHVDRYINVKCLK